ncbi:MAG: hypothetical protein VX938_04270, partial [Myxococcota bacterium]|nr:hypothetical protein [Myxococcota bacterium]
LLLLSMGSMLAADRWVQRPGCARRSLAWAALCSLLVLTHYFGWVWALLLALYGGVSCGKDKGAMGRWLLIHLFVLSAAGLWLPLVLVQARHLPPEVTAHLSSSLPLVELLGLFGPGAGHPMALVSVGAGCLVLGLALWGARSSVGGLAAEGEDEEATSPPPALFVVAILIALITPLVSFALMPMSELLMDLFIQELPTAYGVISLAAFIGVALSRSSHRTPRLPPGALEVSLIVGGGMILGALSLARPVLTPRNLIVFLPPLLVLVAVSIASQSRGRRFVWMALLMSAAAFTLPGNQDRFQPRPDLRGAAERLASGVGPSVVWPRWDAPGIAHYTSSPPLGILDSQELPPPAGKTFDLVLTREGVDQPEAFLSAVSAHLGDGFSRTDRWEGRGVVWCRWTRTPTP